MHIGLVVSDDFDYGPDLATGLVAAGASVTLYLSKKFTTLYLWGTDIAPTEFDSDTLVEHIYARELVPRSCRIRFFDFPRIRDPRSFKVARELSGLISHDGLDLIHILMGPGELWIAVLACLTRKLPVVSTMIIPEPNVGEKLPRFILWSIAKLLTLGSNMIIVNGADQVELVHKLYHTPMDKVAYVPLMPRTSAIQWADNAVPEERGIVLFPGKAQPRKGLEYLVKAQPFITDQVPHAKIVIAAHGEELDRCRSMMTDESKFEIYEGFLTGAELAAFFQRASVVALPYLSASTSGLLMTAYVFGKPVVTTNVGALPEYLKDGLMGYLVPPRNEKRLAEAIINILSNDDLRFQMGENAQQWINRERSRVISQKIELYRSLISK